MKHIPTFKNFLNEETGNIENYMVIGNLKTMQLAIEKLLSMDPKQIDQIIKDGHDWAEDHIAVATENLSQVTDFMINEIKERGTGITPTK